MSVNMSRREFLKGAGLAVAVVATPLGFRVVSAADMAGKEASAFTPSAWLRITPDALVTVIVNKSEMGQGVYTSLPMIVADELEADWNKVRIEPAPAGTAYKDPVWGFQATGGSSSVRHMNETLRMAGAAAREMLVAAAAQEWNVKADECEAREGSVMHGKTGRSLSYGKLATAAARQPVPAKPALKNESRFRYRGKPLPRLDVREKVNGTARFGIDVFVPGMLYAALERPPRYYTEAYRKDREAPLKIAGVRRVVDLKSGIAVCADSLEAAKKGRDALGALWDLGEYGLLDSAQVETMFRNALGTKGVTAKEQGNAPATLGKAAKTVEATYFLPYLAHATLEPMNCTAHVRSDGCDVWVPTQNQSGVMQMAAGLTGLPPERINVHTTYLGGGFGRRFELDVVEEALLLSKETGKPIKLIWSREEDMQNDFYRPANACTIKGGVDGGGNLSAWSQRIVCPSIFARVFPDQVKNGIDPAAVEGVADMIYEIPNLFVDYVRLDASPVPVGFWRSVGNSHNAFTVESFMDELAHAAQKDPLSFRLGLLRNQPHAIRVLRECAEKAGWGQPMMKGYFQGIALHHSFGSYVAQIAEVAVDKGTGKIKVRRVVCAVDCGPVVNPGIVRAQMEGGILFGLSAALKEQVKVKNGGIASTNFDTYDILRIDESPRIEVYIVKGMETPGGIGEPGVPPIAPAVANAVFAATGARLRTLPMTPETVLKAMQKG